MALAIWFMDDGSKIENTARIATNCFTLDEINLLCQTLNLNFNISATPNKAGQNKGYVIRIKTSSMTTFANLIKPYMIKSLYYKLGNY
jgi:hypothetical protein